MNQPKTASAKVQIRKDGAYLVSGASKNKPFCDGTHASIKFSDEK